MLLVRGEINNMLREELLNYGIQTLDEDNGKYTFFTEITRDINLVCPKLFDRSIAVGSVIIVRKAVYAKISLAVFVACNASSAILLNKAYKYNNIQWRELTDSDFLILPGDISSQTQQKGYGSEKTDLRFSSTSYFSK